MKLTTDDIILRPWSPIDITPMYEAIRESGPSLKPWIKWYHDGYSEQDAEKFIRLAQKSWGKVWHSFAIYHINGKLLGSMDLIVSDSKSGVIGYWVRQSEQRKGVAKAALEMILSYGFNHLKLQEVQFIIAVDNIASRKTAESIGAIESYKIARYIMTETMGHDAIAYKLDRGQYDSRTQRT
jgi:RimJ/RimL family protein N-acetyltransferase